MSRFQVMPGVQWLELLCKHIPDRHEHIVGTYVEKYATVGAFNQALDTAGYPPEGVARPAQK